MKQLLLILSLLMTVLQGLAQARVSFDKTTHHFGTILWKTPVTATFRVTNTGDKPLVISAVTTSCGCTVADWTKEPISPGAAGTVSSTFDAQALGHFQKSVGIYCNASSLPIYLTLSGQVSASPRDYALTHPFAIGDIRLSRDALEFEDASKGDHPVIELQVANTSDRIYTPVLMHLPPYLSVEAMPERLEGERTGKLLVTLDTEKLPKLGFTKSSVYLSRFSGDKVSVENEIPVSAVLLPDFSHLTAQERAHPPVIHLSDSVLTVDPQAKGGKYTQTFILSNIGSGDLEILDLQVSDPALGVQLKKRTLQPGASTKLKVIVYTGRLKTVRGTPRVLMITNDSACPKSTVKVKIISK